MYGPAGNVHPVRSIAAMSGDRPLDVSQVRLEKKQQPTANTVSSQHQENQLIAASALSVFLAANHFHPQNSTSFAVCSYPVSNDALFVQKKKLEFRVRVSCHSGVSATSF